MPSVVNLDAFIFMIFPFIWIVHKIFDKEQVIPLIAVLR